MTHSIDLEQQQQPVTAAVDTVRPVHEHVDEPPLHGDRQQQPDDENDAADASPAESSIRANIVGQQVGWAMGMVVFACVGCWVGELC